MEKLKKLLKLKEKQLSFYDLDYQYQMHFIKEYILAAFISILLIVLCIFLKEYLFIVGIVLIAVGYCAYVSFHLYKSLINEVIIIDGKCTNIITKESFLSKKDPNATTRKIIIETDNNIKIEQNVPVAARYNVGDTVRIFTYPKSLGQINQNTYTVINPIFMYVLSK